MSFSHATIPDRDDDTSDSDGDNTVRVSKVCVLGPATAARAVLLGLCGIRAADVADAVDAVQDADDTSAGAAQTDAPVLLFCDADRLEQARVPVALPCTTHRLRCVRVPDVAEASPASPLAVQHATHRARAVVLAWPCTDNDERGTSLTSTLASVLAGRVPGTSLACGTPCVLAIVHSGVCACQDSITTEEIADAVIVDAQERCTCRLSVVGVTHVRAGWVCDSDVHGAGAWAGLREALAWCAEAAECRAVGGAATTGRDAEAEACLRHAAEALVPARVPSLQWLAARALREVLQDTAASDEGVRLLLPSVLHDHVLWL